MVSVTEIWLRLMAVQGMSGECALRHAHFLTSCAVIDEACLTASGFNSREKQLYLSLTASHIDATYRWLEMPRHHLVVADDDNYPEVLRAIPDFPPALLVAGDPRLLLSMQLAIVGSRDCSDYGREQCRVFSEALSRTGLVITSGLALGIDSEAHIGALRAQGRTIAVLGNGLSAIYPHRHVDLARCIIEQDGAIISTFPLHYPPRPCHFPWRNRIISGLSRGVLVVEACERSGSLVTARYAVEQGRDVFALPGPVNWRGSAGPHWLIQQGAYLVTKPQDIVNDLQSSLCWLTD